MLKIDKIKQKCQEAVDDLKALEHLGFTGDNKIIEEGRAELAEEILEIIKGEQE